MRGQSRLKSLLSIFRSRLANRFARYTVGLSLFVALIISAVFSYQSYHDNLHELNDELTQVEHSVKNSLVLHLWQLNMNALNLLLDDLLIDKDIDYVKLLDEKDKVLIEKGRKPPRQKAIERSLPLYYHPGQSTKKIYLGKLDYTATTKAVDREIVTMIPEVFIAIFVFFILLSLLILYIYWGSTVKHLTTIKEYANMIRLGGYRNRIDDLKLERQKNHADEDKDELDELVDSINTMHHEIIAQYTTVEYQSLHDELTGLPNKRLINNLLSDTITHCRAADGYGALLSIDLDNFRLFNESVGHAFGDKVLCKIADRLRAVCDGRFHLARISGDEFIILQSELAPDREEARKIAQNLSEKILSILSQTMTVEGHTFKISACIGIVLFGPEAKADVAIKQADNALHHAKTEGPGHFSFFEPMMQVQIDRRLQLERLIDKVIEKDLLTVSYQPKYDAERQICSAEALVRLHDEENIIIYPDEFIPILEQTGAITEVGDHIIRKVFEFIHRRRDEIERAGLNNIAINVSPTQYASSGFAKRVTALAEAFDINPEFIIFEITEEVAAGAIDNIIDIMRQLTQQGFKFSIDDFGTGYSSLRYLKNLPLTELKIDKSFVDEITKENRADAIVKTIIDMAHNFKLVVVAEGVESEDQFDILAKYRCDQYQGYLFSKPLPEEAFLDKLRGNDDD